SKKSVRRRCRARSSAATTRSCETHPALPRALLSSGNRIDYDARGRPSMPVLPVLVVPFDADYPDRVGHVIRIAVFARDALRSAMTRLLAGGAAPGLVRV